MFGFFDDSEDEEFFDPQAAARANGFSWGEIWDYVAGATSKALSVGYSEKDVNHYLGYSDPEPMQARSRTQWAGEIASNPKLVEDFGGAEPKLNLASSRTLMLDLFFLT